MKYYANMSITGIGLDITDIERFRELPAEGKNRFLTNTFSEQELAYCNAFSDPAPHFAGLFAAKEAVQKAAGISGISLSEIEVRHRESGAPEVWIRNEKRPLLISISHSKSAACAVAVSTDL